MDNSSGILALPCVFYLLGKPFIYRQKISAPPCLGPVNTMFSAAQVLKACQCKAEGAALGGPKRKSDNAAVASWSGLPCGADVERR
ncbi:hypothetical protein, partial [Aquitalea sp. FJL05]|uniref:hypothetical protein n=1 Tax=Aquitalea sp. FJL05 TaxID=2153366 RepID=UPI001F21577B